MKSSCDKPECSTCPESLTNNSVLNAAERGNVNAQYLAGLWYLDNPLGNGPDIARGVHWLAQAAKSRQPQALAYLGKAMIYGGLEPVCPVIVSEGLGLLSAAIREGHQESSLYVGTAHLEGVPELGIRKDEFTGLAFVSLAALRGEPRALEILIRHGLETNRPAEETFVWVGLLSALSPTDEVTQWCIDLALAATLTPGQRQVISEEIPPMLKRIRAYQQREAVTPETLTQPTMAEPLAPLKLVPRLLKVGLPNIATRYAQLLCSS